MAYIAGTVIGALITPGSDVVSYGTHLSKFGIGGFVEVQDITERDAIPVDSQPNVLLAGDKYTSGRRRLGMLVYVRSTDSWYQLTDVSYEAYTTDTQRYSSLQNNSNWTVPSLGAAASNVVYGGSWSGSLVAPSKNAVYNKIESMYSDFVRITGSTMTGSLILNADPTNALGAVTKQYVDNFTTGLSWKDAVKAATTGNITLSGAQTIDGVSIVAGDRVLVLSQTDPKENGIYVANSGSWTRSNDTDTGAEMKYATTVVLNGTANALKQYTCNTAAPITLGTDNINFVQIAGGGGVYINGTGLSLTGNTFSVDGTVVRTTGSQTISGIKTFSSNPIFSLTAGSVVFAGTSGVITEDNTNLFFNDTTNRLGIGTNTPGAKLHLRPVSSEKGLIIQNPASSVNSPLEIQDSTGNLIAGFNNLGDLNLSSLTGIKDSVNNTYYLQFIGGASRINNFRISNAATGNNPTLEVIGTNNDIGINLLSKGIGYFVDQNTQATLIAKGTSVQEPGQSSQATPVNGMLRYDSTLNKFRGYENGSWVNLIPTTGSGTVNTGAAGRLALYPSTGTLVDDVYVQNTRNIEFLVASQSGRTQDIIYNIPNPGNAVTTTNFILKDSIVGYDLIASNTSSYSLKLTNSNPGNDTDLQVSSPNNNKASKVSLINDIGTSLIVSINGSTIGGGLINYTGTGNLTLQNNANGGDLIFNTGNPSASERIRIKSTGGISLTLGSDATADSWYRNSSGNMARVGIGANNDLYTVVGGLPAWRSVSSTLGYTPANPALFVAKAGDTMSGDLVMNSNVILNNNNEIRLGELTTNGTEYIALKAPVALTASYSIILPSIAPSAGSFLGFNGTNYIWNSIGGGTVTSVGLSLPNIFSVSGSPVTSTGTLTATLSNQSSNTVFASPDGSTGVPVFRTLVNNDIPNLDTAKITSGAFADNRISSSSNWNSKEPGLGNPSVNGYVLSSTTTGTRSWVALPTVAVTSVFGRTGNVVATNGDYNTTQVTEGSNLYFTNTRAQAAISNTSPITYSGGVIGIQVANTSQGGYLTSADWNTFNNKGNTNSGVAGRLALYPSTGTTVDDQYTQNSNLIDVGIAAHTGLASSRSYSIVNVGTSASFLMGDGNNTLAGKIILTGGPFLGGPAYISNGTETIKLTLSPDSAWGLVNNSGFYTVPGKLAQSSSHTLDVGVSVINKLTYYNNIGSNTINFNISNTDLDFAASGTFDYKFKTNNGNFTVFSSVIGTKAFEVSLPTTGTKFTANYAQIEQRYYNAANTFYTSLKAGSNTANLNLTLPIADGSSGQVLTTNGAGVLSFSNVGNGVYIPLAGTTTGFPVSGDIEFSNNKHIYSKNDITSTSLNSIFFNDSGRVLINSENGTDSVGILVKADNIQGLQLSAGSDFPIKINSTDGNIDIQTDGVLGAINLSSPYTQVSIVTPYAIISSELVNFGIPGSYNQYLFFGSRNSDFRLSGKLLTLNWSNSTSSILDGSGVGIQVQERIGSGLTVQNTGHFKTTSDRNGWEIKAPNRTGIVSIISPTNSYTANLPNKAASSNETFAMLSDISGLGGGSVSSVGLSLPNIFSVSGSPVTGSGTLTGTLVSQPTNTVFAAPNGSTGTPTFRTLVNNDIPNLDTTKITSGIFSVSRGGTGLGTIGSSLQMLRVNSGGSALEFFTPSYISANQTITLTGDVTGNGSTSITTTLGANVVTYSKLQQVNALRLLGNSTSSTANVQEINLGVGLSFSGGSLVNTINNTNQLTNGSGYITNVTGFITAGTNVTITGSGTSGSPYIINSVAGGSGTVTSVGLGNIAGLATATGSPVTSSGTLGYNLNTQSSNLVFAGPASGSSATPAFRTLVVSDLPTNIPTSSLSSNSISLAIGTTGTNVNWSSSSVSLGGSITLNIPDAGSSTRGLVTTGDQFFSGQKTFQKIVVTGGGVFNSEISSPSNNARIVFYNSGSLYFSALSGTLQFEDNVDGDIIYSLAFGSGGSHQFTGSMITDKISIRNQKSLRFFSAGSDNYIDISAPASVTDYNLVLPSSQGGANTYLKNDGAGNLTWAAVSSGGSGVTTVGSLNGGTISSVGASISGATIYLQSASTTNPGLVSNVAQTFSGDKFFQPTSNSTTPITATGLMGQIGDLTHWKNSSNTILANVTSSGEGRFTGLATLNNSGIRLYNVGNGNYVSLQAPTISANYVYTLPTSYGTNGQVLTTNGAGGMSWTTPASGGITTIGGIDVNIKSINGLSIISNTLYAQTADTTRPGMVSNSSQTFSGNKYFNVLPNGNGGFDNFGLGVGGFANAATLVNFQNTNSNTTGINGLFSQVTSTPSSTPSSEYVHRGAQIRTLINGTTPYQSNTAVVAISINNQNSGITVANANGVRGNVISTSQTSKTITNAKNVVAYSYIDSMGATTNVLTVGNLYNFYSATPFSNDGGGTISVGNMYGLYIDNFRSNAFDPEIGSTGKTIATYTGNTWQIYTAGAQSSNIGSYIGNRLGVGFFTAPTNVSSLAASLHIGGTSSTAQIRLEPCLFDTSSPGDGDIWRKFDDIKFRTGLLTKKFQFSDLLKMDINSVGSTVDGEIWFDGSAFRVRVGGVIKTFTLT